MYCLYLFCFGLKKFILVCKSYYLNGGILFTRASISKVLCCFMISWRLLGKILFGVQRLNSETFWALNPADVVDAEMIWGREYKKQGRLILWWRGETGWMCNHMVNIPLEISVSHLLLENWALTLCEMKTYSPFRVRTIFDAWSFISCPHLLVSICLHLDNVFFFSFFYFV